LEQLQQRWGKVLAISGIIPPPFEARGLGELDKLFYPLLIGDVEVGQSCQEVVSGDRYFAAFDALDLGERPIESFGDVSLGEPFRLARFAQREAEAASCSRRRFSRTHDSL
jgi:hypothetical protein